MNRPFIETGDHGNLKIVAFTREDYSCCIEHSVIVWRDVIHEDFREDYLCFFHWPIGKERRGVKTGHFAVILT